MALLRSLCPAVTLFPSFDTFNWVAFCFVLHHGGYIFCSVLPFSFSNDSLVIMLQLHNANVAWLREIIPYQLRFSWLLLVALILVHLVKSLFFQTPHHFNILGVYDLLPDYAQNHMSVNLLGNSLVEHLAWKKGYVSCRKFVLSLLIYKLLNLPYFPCFVLFFNIIF